MSSHHRKLQRLGAAFHPILERLERRDCPSCTVFQQDQTLVILGDREANQIAIADTREGDIAVTCDGGVTERFFGVQRIVALTFKGDDEITATFANSSDGNFHFRAHLGDGDDRLSISGFDPQPDPPLAAVEFDIRAGAGDDEVLFDLGSAEINGQFVVSMHSGLGNDHLIVGLDPCWLPESEARIGIFGGAGDDLIEMSLTGLESEGRLLLEAAGGLGNDHLVLGAVEPCWLPGSETSIRLHGNAGDDLIEVSMTDLEIEGLFDLTVLGGVGNDVLDSLIVPCVLPTGRGNFAFDGEVGNDRIAARVEMDASSRGALDVEVLGGLGDDDLTLALLGVDELSVLTALLDGGRGHDIARVTRNVRVTNCEEVIFLDEPR